MVVFTSHNCMHSNMRNSKFSLIFFTPICTIFLGLNFLLVSSQCLDDQRSLLLELKTTLHFNPLISTKLANWRNQSSDCCDWPGVACDLAGHVIELDLSYEFLQGGIQNSSALFSLLFLQSLNLADNFFIDTTIPPSFGVFTNLKTLNLSNSGFAGQIPIELSKLKNLTTLDLSGISQDLQLQNPNLSTLIENLTMLTELHMDGVNISAMDRDWCKAISSSLPNLKVLSLSFCHLSGPIDPSFQKLHFLSEIYLDYNNLSVPIPEFFASFSNLTVLSLECCNLSGTFPSKIFQLPKLRILDLGNNQLLTGSLPEFGQDGMIENLVLTASKFSGRLPDSIGNLKVLMRLDLSDCQFSGPIPNSVANLTQLVRLDLQYNQFNGPIPSLQRSKNLSYLDLSHNTLDGSIPASLFSLPLLQEILLSDNQFTGEIIEPMNKSLSPLVRLDISSNNLQGNIPQFVFKFRKLNDLWLAFNNFSGHLRIDIIRNLENLDSLDLSHNNLSIDLSEGDSGLSLFPQLSELKLASCNLKTFPALMNQSNLINLDLSDNQITGKIPNWLWNGSLSYLNLSSNFLAELESPISIRSLYVIDLHFNRLKGEVPIPSASAVYVDYSKNYFDSIPFGNNLSYATYFSLSNNNLSGPIPQSICSAVNLQVLDLSNNGFTGSVPRCLIENITETLRGLNLANNLLTGTVMGKFPESCALKTLDFNGNHLEGKVPKSLANCEYLELLNVRNNQMNDVFPCFLETLTNLWILVLRSNKFQGDIRCPNVTNTTWQKLQIIDLARNDFSGELPADLFLRCKAMMSHKRGPNYINFSSPYEWYYQDTVTVANKGVEMVLVKILTLYTSIDLSGNRFEGFIPEAIGDLKSLYVLNLSHNALTGEIPSALGNLKELGSLDLSWNNLSGIIPSQLTQLSFLEVLNLSYNHLAGMIPTGPQFNTFSESSYISNPDLCGFPLNHTCIDTSMAPSPTPSSNTHDLDLYLSVAVGYLFGLGIFIGPLVLWKRWKKYCYKQVDMILEKIFHLEERQRKRTRQRRTYRDPIRRL